MAKRNKPSNRVVAKAEGVGVAARIMREGESDTRTEAR